MFCKKCGKEIAENSAFCAICGASLKENKSNYSIDTNITYKVDFSGLSSYYQEEFKRIYETEESYKGKWNWAAFFWGAIWALTKQAWLIAVISFIIGLFTYGFSWLVYMFIYGARGNYIYYCAYVKNKQLPF